MFFLRKLFYAICLRKKKERYLESKERAFSGRNAPGTNWFRQHWEKRMPLFLGGTDQYRPRSKLRKFELRVRHHGTFENFITKSFIGFSCGVLLMYGLYFLFVFPLGFSFGGATLLCCLIGFVSILGLAFSAYFRSIALLSLPAFISAKGRQALTTYAIILAVTGPGKNSVQNVKVLTESIACSQERLSKSLKEVSYLMVNPLAPIKNSLKIVIAKVIDIAKKIKNLASAVERMVLNLDDIVKLAFQRLEQVIAFCGTKAGRSYKTCTTAMKSASDDCKARMSNVFKGLCESEEVSKTLCQRLSSSAETSTDYLDSHEKLLSRRIRKQISSFIRKVKALLKFKLTKSYEAYHEHQNSKPQGRDLINPMNIALDIRQFASSILYLFDSVSILFSLFYMVLFYSVINFRNKYLAHEWYENRYITSNLLLIEMRRMREKKTTIFPLSRMERQKYIKINSLSLMHMDVIEVYYMTVKAVGLFVKLSLHIAADYGLWWLIMECRKAVNQVQVPEGMSNIEILTDSSEGIPGRIYDELVNAFQPKRFNFTTDMASCVPEPGKPDYKRYATIMMISLLTIITSFIEPYGKRVKLRIMNFYYPTIARRRAVWLYNHILRTRNSFTKVARRRLRKQFVHCENFGNFELGIQLYFLQKFAEKYQPKSHKTCCRFWNTLASVLLRLFEGSQYFIPTEKFNRCILCKVYGAPEDPLTRCATPGCKGTYCLECFANLQNVCTLCLDPNEYNDVSDISEEQDSSDEGDWNRWNARTKSREARKCEVQEASTAEEEDFERDSLADFRVVENSQNPAMDEEYLPQIEETCLIGDDKEKEWSTMKDFELPKETQAKDAIAEHGVAITLKQRVKEGFTGHIFAKPIFNRAAPLGNEEYEELGTISESSTAYSEELVSFSPSRRSKLSRATAKLKRWWRKNVSRRGTPLYRHCKSEEQDDAQPSPSYEFYSSDITGAGTQCFRTLKRAKPEDNWHQVQSRESLPGSPTSSVDLLRGKVRGQQYQVWPCLYTCSSDYYKMESRSASDENSFTDDISTGSLPSYKGLETKQGTKRPQPSQLSKAIESHSSSSHEYGYSNSRSSGWKSSPQSLTTTVNRRGVTEQQKKVKPSSGPSRKITSAVIHDSTCSLMYDLEDYSPSQTGSVVASKTNRGAKDNFVWEKKQKRKVVLPKRAQSYQCYSCRVTSSPTQLNSPQPPFSAQIKPLEQQRDHNTGFTDAYSVTGSPGSESVKTLVDSQHEEESPTSSQQVVECASESCSDYCGSDYDCGSSSSSVQTVRALTTTNTMQDQMHKGETSPVAAQSGYISCRDHSDGSLCYDLLGHASSIKPCMHLSSNLPLRPTRIAEKCTSASEGAVSKSSLKRGSCMGYSSESTTSYDIPSRLAPKTSLGHREKLSSRNEGMEFSTSYSLYSYGSLCYNMASTSSKTKSSSTLKVLKHDMKPEAQLNQEQLGLSTARARSFGYDDVSSGSTVQTVRLKNAKNCYEERRDSPPRRPRVKTTASYTDYGSVCYELQDESSTYRSNTPCLRSQRREATNPSLEINLSHQDREVPNEFGYHRDLSSSTSYPEKQPPKRSTSVEETGKDNLQSYHRGTLTQLGGSRYDVISILSGDQRKINQSNNTSNMMILGNPKLGETSCSSYIEYSSGSLCYDVPSSTQSSHSSIYRTKQEDYERSSAQGTEYSASSSYDSESTSSRSLAPNHKDPLSREKRTNILPSGLALRAVGFSSPSSQSLYSHNRPTLKNQRLRRRDGTSIPLLSSSDIVYPEGISASTEESDFSETESSSSKGSTICSKR